MSHIQQAKDFQSEIHMLQPQQLNELAACTPPWLVLESSPLIKYLLVPKIILSDPDYRPRAYCNLQTEVDHVITRSAHHQLLEAAGDKVSENVLRPQMGLQQHEEQKQLQSQ
jgi:hypothetical protein